MLTHHLTCALAYAKKKHVVSAMRLERATRAFAVSGHAVPHEVEIAEQLAKISLETTREALLAAHDAEVARAAVLALYGLTSVHVGPAAWPATLVE